MYICIYTRQNEIEKVKHVRKFMSFSAGVVVSFQAKRKYIYKLSLS